MTKFECRKTDTAKKSDFVIIYSENRDTSFPPTRWGQRHFFLANMKLTIHFLICSNERKSIREICLLLLLPTGHSLVLTSIWWHVCSWWATLVTSLLPFLLITQHWRSVAMDSTSLHTRTPHHDISQSGLCLTLNDGQAFSAVSSHQLELKVWKVMCKMESFYSHKLLSSSCYLNPKTH